MQVREHPNSYCFIAENFERTWKCFIPASRVVAPLQDGSFVHAYPLASAIHFNAVLIDERNPVQYMATIVWSKRDVLPNAAELARRDVAPESHLLQVYRKYLDGLRDPAAGVNAVASPYYESAEAKVFKLLDDNFGVLEVKDRLVLFDTCDFWLDQFVTADKVTELLLSVLLRPVLDYWVQSLETIFSASFTLFWNFNIVIA